MARNIRPGTKWVPGTIKKQLGPLTFLVEIEPGILWKRHIDHIHDRELNQSMEFQPNEQTTSIENDSYIMPSENEPTMEDTNETDTPRYPEQIHVTCKNIISF